MKRFSSYLNFISDLVRWIVSTQDVDSVSHTHGSSIETSTLKWPLTLPHTRLWTKTVDLDQEKGAYFELYISLFNASYCNVITDNSFISAHLMAHLVGGQVTEVQGIINWHGLDQCSMEELSELCHQAAPLVLLGVVAEEAVQWGVKGVCDLHLWPQCVDNTATGTGLRVEDGSGQRADWAPGLGQRVIVLHLEERKGNHFYTSSDESTSEPTMWSQSRRHRYLQQTGSPPSGSPGPSSDDVHSVQAGHSCVRGSGLQHGRCRRAGEGHRTEAPNLVRGVVERLGHMETYCPTTVPPATACHKHLRSSGKTRRWWTFSFLIKTYSM